MSKNNTRGITLVALVITVIVLLILAGVVINAALGSSGLIQTVENAVSQWNTAASKEEEATQEMWSEVEDMSASEITIESTLPEGWNGEKIASVAVADNKRVPIPEGYVASSIAGENTILNGLVIYEGTTAVDSTNYEQALTDRNQYVWIPVDNINDMIICKSKTATTQCNIAVQGDGSLKCTVHNSTDIAGRLYLAIDSTSTTENGKEIYKETISFKRDDQTYRANVEYREPDILEIYDTNATNLSNAGVSTFEQFKSNLTSDFNAMAKSVAKYGGFYVARYELQAGAASKMNQNVLTACSNGEWSGSWYGLYKVARTSNSTVSTHMIWGSQYDQIVKFLRSKAKTGHLLGENISETKSGLSLNDVYKNIYDLEGCHFEWTAEAYWQGRRTCRSGSYWRLVENSMRAISMRDTIDAIGAGDANYGSRLTLYIEV